MKRAAIFSANLEKIKKHNERFEQGLETFTKGINQFTDMTEKEFLDHISGLPPMDAKLKEKYPTDKKFANFLASKAPSAPDSFSWVDQGAVTSVKNQASCGSCTAFAVVGTLDTCYYKASGNLFDDLSEQYLVDCANNHYFGDLGAFGCSGAWPQAYFDYMEKYESGRVQTESAYPYTAQDGSCRSSASGWYNVAQTSWKNVWSPDEESIKAWISEVGPVVTTIEAGTDFGGYSGGVLNSQYCCDTISDSSCSYRNNHAVAVVGYGQENGLDFWLVKNSWGNWWGDRGFFKVKRGTGHCGMFGHSASGPTSCA